MPATRTRLAGVGRVDLDHLDATRFGFVGKKALELSKRPAMETALIAHILVLLAAPDLGCFADILEVLNSNGTAWGGVLNNAFGKDMIVISSLPKLLARKLFQVPFSRRRAFFLKGSTETEDAAFLLFPTTISQEITLGSDCRAIQSQAYTNDFLCSFNQGRGLRYDDMQEVAALPETEISGTDRPADVLACVLGDQKGYFLPSGHTGKTTGQLSPLDPLRTRIVADRRTDRDRSCDWLEDRRLASRLLGFGYLFRIVGSVLFFQVSADVTASAALTRAAQTNCEGRSGYCARKG